ncbi:MAG: hypothetical protein QOG65_1885, partial [Actinomycetota bacterium]|nr:hypothetical protein [Actinomycetota bacterium]
MTAVRPRGHVVYALVVCALLSATACSSSKAKVSPAATTTDGRGKATFTID